MKLYKTLFLALVVIGATFPCFVAGQFVTRKAKDSVENTATKLLTWTSTPDGVKGFQLSTEHVSGTVNAHAILETRIDTVLNLWAPVHGADTFHVPNGTNAAHVWPLLPQSGNGYRIRINSTGTQKFYVYAAYLRRTQ